MSGKPPELEIDEQSPGTFVVHVKTARTPTTHLVTVSSGLGAQIGGDGTTDHLLVEVSFRFLLEREPNTSILKTFDIEVIGNYFPEWRSEITKRLQAR